MTKDQFTSPETLIKRGKIDPSPNQTSDIYSFGMLCWFLLKEEIPFEGYNLDQIKQIIVDKRSRPKIYENMNRDIAEIVAACWQEDASLRPTFGDVNELLTRVNFD